MRLRWSAHLSWLFPGLPYMQRVEAAHRAGFVLAETVGPGAAEREALPAALAAHGMRLALLNCNAGDLDAGERGFLNDPARREELERDFRAAVELALACGAPAINVLVGRRPAVASVRSQRSAVVSALRALAPVAAERGVRLLIEPLNEIENPGYLAPTPADAAELIEQCGSDALGLTFDVYHVARAGGDPQAEIARFGELIGHVQVADVPGRGPPGSGALDLWGILERLDASGYRGAVGLEYVPRDTGEASFAFLSDERWVVGQ
jgi:hydroxypyruvate isomerase